MCTLTTSHCHCIRHAGFLCTCIVHVCILVMICCMFGSCSYLFYYVDVHVHILLYYKNVMLLQCGNMMQWNGKLKGGCIVQCIIMDTHNNCKLAQLFLGELLCPKHGHIFILLFWTVFIDIHIHILILSILTLLLFLLLL